MAVEKMMMVNLIGQMKELDPISKSVIIFGIMHTVSAIDEINTADFTIKVDEENKGALMELDYIRPFINTRVYKALKEKVEKIKLMRSDTVICDVKDKELILDFDELNKALDEVLNKFEDTFIEYNAKKEKEAEYTAVMEHFKFISGLNIRVEELMNMKNFYSSLLKVPAENMIKLRHNSENIPALVFDISKGSDFETIVTFTPIVFKAEADRIFESLNCEEIFLEHDYQGTPKDIVKDIQVRLAALNKEIIQLKKNLEDISKENKKTIEILVKSADLEMKCDTIKNNIAYSEDFFYLCGWIPKSELKVFKDKMEVFKNKMVMIVKNTNETEIKATPPTRLKNNFIVKPFEAMVNMYGVPSYGELDPTTFLGLSYMLLFGAMFGDVGQGFLFFIAGIVMKYFKGMDTSGGIIGRLGISSMVFGIGYGSVFGFENVIKPMLIRPMENILETLIYAVVFGFLLLITGFIYSLINNIRKKDMKNGLFGKDGAAGLSLYLLAITFALSKYKNISLMPDILWIVLFFILLALILLKEPAANLMKNKRPLFSESKQDYFVEEGFGVIETVLSMFTNTLSFIRVGAFALNHVGLFLAFAALAAMIHNNVGSVLIYIIGNIVIIGLEGLIVFIQGLRLEYYELFSKYYEAEGIPFQPVRLDVSKFCKAEAESGKINLINKFRIKRKIKN